MIYEIFFTEKARKDLTALKDDPSKENILNAVIKTLGFMKTNLRHPSLNTHEFKSEKGPEGQKMFEAYVQHKTSSAYRIFWYYGPLKNQLSIAAIIAHPRNNQKNL